MAIPPSVGVATEKNRDEEDKVLQFLSECCHVHPHTQIKASALYDAYKTWYKDNQFGSGVNATLFGHEISKRFEKETCQSRPDLPGHRIAGRGGQSRVGT